MSGTKKRNSIHHLRVENDRSSFSFSIQREPSEFFPVALQTSVPLVLFNARAMRPRGERIIIVTAGKGGWKKGKTKMKAKRCKSNETKYRAAAAEGSAPTEFFSGITDLYFIYKSPDLPLDMCVFSVYPCSENAPRQTFPRSQGNVEKRGPYFPPFCFSPIPSSTFCSIPLFRSPRSVSPCFLLWWKG